MGRVRGRVWTEAIKLYAQLTRLAQFFLGAGIVRATGDDTGSGETDLGNLDAGEVPLPASPVAGGGD